MIPIGNYKTMTIRQAQFESACPVCHKQFYWAQTFKPDSSLWLYYEGSCCGFKWAFEVVGEGIVKQIGKVETESPDKALSVRESLERMS